MKFPTSRRWAREAGWYKVGPLARVQNCDSDPAVCRARAPRARRLRAAAASRSTAALAFHWARMIEMLHAAETIKDLLHDDDLSGTELMTRRRAPARGVGVIEARAAPSSTTTASATTTCHHGQPDRLHHQQQPGDERGGARGPALPRRPEITEGLLNHVEVAIRAFDPCLSCATHALGQMPLEVTLVDAEGTELDRKYKAFAPVLVCGWKSPRRRSDEPRRARAAVRGGGRGDEAAGDRVPDRFPAQVEACAGSASP